MRTFVALFCILTVWAAESRVPAAPDETAKKPNVVIIYADDLGYGDLSCYGATKIKTPHIDAVAEKGLRFTNAHCTHATCTPSRYSIMTGQYAWRKEGTGILPGDAPLILPTDRTTLGKVFQNAGYKTAMIGKWHLGLGGENGPDWNGEIKPGPNEVGFDYSFVFPATADRVPTVYIENKRVVGLDSNDPIEVNYKEKIGNDFTGKENPELLKMPASPNHGHDFTIVNGIGRIGWMSGGNRARWTDESLAGDFTDQAVQFIEKQKDAPFFMFFATSNIHVPRMPDTRFKGKSGLGYRGDSILELDHIAGRIDQKLTELGIRDNTILIISSDNGPVLDDGYVDGAVTELNGHRQNGVLRGGKGSIFEAGTRIPFIVRWPERVKPGVSKTLVSQIDLLASFARLTGQEIPAGDAPDSSETLGALLGEAEKGRESVVVTARAMALIKDDWKYIEPQKGPALLKMTNVESGLTIKPQLYNLADDIGEKNNLASQNPDRVKEMAAELQAIRDKK